MFITIVLAIIVFTLNQSRWVILLFDVFVANNLYELIYGSSDELGVACNQLNVPTAF